MSEPAAHAPATRWLEGLLLVGLALLPYLGVLHGDFVAGDIEFIGDNASLRAPGWWRDAFAHSYWYQGGVTDQAPYYRPLVVLLDGLSWAWFGADTLGYHLTNSLLHALASLSVWRLLRLLLAPRFALWAASLFAVHPIQVHAVAYISGRTSVLCTWLVVSSIVCGLRADDARERGAQLRWSGASLLFFAAALLAKEHAVVAPLLGLCAVWARSDQPVRIPRLRAPRLGLELSLVVGYLLLRKQVLGQLGGTTPAVWERLGPGSALLSIAKIVGFYPQKLLWPSGLSYLPPFVPALDAGDLVGWCWLLGLIATLVALVVWRMRYRLECALTAWMLIALAPVSGLAPLEYFVKEHHAYLASVGFVGLVARLTQRLLQRAPALKPWLLRVAAGSLVLSLALLSLVHAEDFRDTRALYQRIVALEPAISDAAFAHPAMKGSALRFAVARLNLGLLELEAGRFDAAHAHFTRARLLSPTASMRYQTEFLAAESLLRAGALERAARAFDALSEREPKRPEAESKLAEIAGMQGRKNEVVQHLKTACQRGSTPACQRAAQLARE